MKELLFQEILHQNKSHNIIKHFVLFLLFAITSTIVINSPEDFQKFGMSLCVIYIPLFLLNTSYSLIKSDVNDGNLEFLLTARTSLQIVICKFLSLVFNGLVSIVIMTPIIMVFFDPAIDVLVMFFLCSILVLILSSSLIILVASIQSYFRNNTNFLTVMIMPLIFPNIIITGMVMDDPLNISLLFILLGVNLLIIPPILYLSQYLIDNIYNI